MILGYLLLHFLTSKTGSGCFLLAALLSLKLQFVYLFVIFSDLVCSPPQSCPLSSVIITSPNFFCSLSKEYRGVCSGFPSAVVSHHSYKIIEVGLVSFFSCFLCLCQSEEESTELSAALSCRWRHLWWSRGFRKSVQLFLLLSPETWQRNCSVLPASVRIKGVGKGVSAFKWMPPDNCFWNLLLIRLSPMPSLNMSKMQASTQEMQLWCCPRKPSAKEPLKRSLFMIVEGKRQTRFLFSN